MTDWIQAIASLLTMGAAFLALRIASKAPKLAASYAEEFRRESARIDEERALQIYVFRCLMKGRSEIVHPDTRAAINLCEAAFPDDPRVRAARRMFTKASLADPFDHDGFVKAYLSLLESVTVAVGLGDKIDRFDIESGYYPKALGILDEAAIADASAKLAIHAQSIPPHLR